MIGQEFPNVLYGKTTKTEESSLFYVEVMWPDTRSARMKAEDWPYHPKWGRYCPTAFNDKRNPGTRKHFGSTIGTFDKENPDVANHPSRAGCEADITRVMAFKDPAAALAYAVRLSEVGELACKQDAHQEAFILAHAEASKLPLPTRVVHERKAMICKVVDALLVNGPVMA